MSQLDARFAGLRRLVSGPGLDRLRCAHVGVVGIGGVGSWAAEALARSAIGALTLVDLDEVCVSNVNRQLHALDLTFGQAKVAAMAERIHGINPDCRVTRVAAFFTPATADAILAGGFDWVIDAIDSVSNKTLLLAACHQRGVSVVTCGGAAGRGDPTLIRLADLAGVTHDRLLFQVRRQLRRDHGFPRAGKPFGIPAVFSPEVPSSHRCDGLVDQRPDRTGEAAHGPLTCDDGLGTAAFVTGAFGLAAASVVVRRLVALTDPRGTPDSARGDARPTG
jgi:tRNA A37 threonylcarbamoyladenosine dehydratase